MFPSIPSFDFDFLIILMFYFDECKTKSFSMSCWKLLFDFVVHVHVMIIKKRYHIRMGGKASSNNLSVEHFVSI